MINVSASGKLMLLGDHTAVYGQPCLVSAVTPRVKVDIETNQENLISVLTPDFSIPVQKKVSELLNDKTSPSTRFIESAVKFFYKKFKIKSGVNIHTHTEEYFRYGLGSSAAVTAATIFGLSKLFNKNLKQKDIFKLAYQAVYQVQGLGSGFDVAASTWGGVMYYVTPGKIIEPINISDLPMIVAFSGQKADTVKIVKDVAEKFKSDPGKAKRICTACGKLVEQAKKSLLQKDWERVGVYMNMNQDYLRSLGVSTEKLELLISTALKAGAYGAKLSGAGGGDCMIAIAPEEKIESVKQAINHAGGKVIDVTTNVEGVRIEK